MTQSPEAVFASPDRGCPLRHMDVPGAHLAIQIGTSERYLASAVGMRPAVEGLNELVPIGGKRPCRPRHIEPPDSIGTFSYQASCLCMCRLKPIYPVPQCTRIVLAQILHITGFEAGTFSDSDGFAGRNQFTIREDIRLYKRAGAQHQPLCPACPPGQRTRRCLSNTMVEEKPTRASKTVDRREIARELGAPNMLKHAHAHDLVEGVCALQVAIIANLDTTALLQPRRSDALASEGSLRLAEGDTQHLHAEVLGSVDGQASPPTPNIEQASSGWRRSFRQRCSSFSSWAMSRSSSPERK